MKFTLCQFLRTFYNVFIESCIGKFLVWSQSDIHLEYFFLSQDIASERNVYILKFCLTAFVSLPCKNFNFPDCNGVCFRFVCFSRKKIKDQGKKKKWQSHAETLRGRCSKAVLVKARVIQLGWADGESCRQRGWCAVLFLARVCLCSKIKNKGLWIVCAGISIAFGDEFLMLL